MHMQTPRFDWSINFGQIMQLATLLFGFAGTMLFLAGERAEIKRDLATVAADRAKYIPMIEAMVNSNAIQDDRINALSESAREQRRTNSEILLVLGTVREKVAGIDARIPQIR